MGFASNTSSPVAPGLWLQVLEEEYLRAFIPSGRSCVKFVSGTSEVLHPLVERLEELAKQHQFFYSYLDPGRLTDAGKKPALHSIDQFFFALTCEMDWKTLAQEQARTLLERQDLSVPATPGELNLDNIAEANGRSRERLLSQWETALTREHIRDRAMGAEFRNAMAALAHAQLVPGDLLPSAEEVLLHWLRGATVKGGAHALKKVQIYERIKPSNGWTVLRSFAHWLPKAGYPGLLAVLDFRPYEKSRVPQTAINKQIVDYVHKTIQEGGNIAGVKARRDALIQPPVLFGSVAYLRMLGLLRTFIDSAGEFEHTILVVLTSPEYHSGTADVRSRRVTDYDALQTRIGQEVYDTRFANPCAALVHLGTSS